MENAVHALKISAAVLIFIVALGIAFNCISEVKKAATNIFYYADKTNKYQTLENVQTNDNGRIVNVDTIISNLYKIDEESLAIKVILENGNEINFESYKGLDEKIQEFKNKYMDNMTYVESFSEVILTGIYMDAEDGTQVTISPGGKKTYITYERMGV